MQDPSNTQNYNRYGYCWNNPLKFTDPDGEWIWIVVGAVIGGTLNWIAHGAQFNARGLTAFGIGAAAGALAGIVGPAAFTAAGGGAAGAGGFLAGAAGGAAGAAVSQTVLSVGNHVAFGDPLMTPKQFIVGVVTGVVIGGVINGASAVKHGGRFTDGVDPTPKVATISTKPAGVVKIGKPAEAQTDLKLPNTTQANTPQTTQNNTATVINRETGVVDVSKNPDFRIIDDGGGTNSVYQGVDKATGQVKYIGITERAPDIRFSEHLNSVGTGKELLEYRVIDGMQNLSRINARILEQSLINQNGMNNLLNMRNSIAPKYWGQYGIKP